MNTEQYCTIDIGTSVETAYTYMDVRSVQYLLEEKKKIEKRK